MKISLDSVSKKFQRHWIFKDVSYEFHASRSYALLGSNGSGKSTLLRIIGGIQAVTKGKVSIELNGKLLEGNGLFPYISFCAPGMEIVEELTLLEFFQFHFRFKNPVNGLSPAQIIDIIGLKGHANKMIGDYSSGMKQRVKLAQAIFSDTPLLLLDEPCTNLDPAGVQQYQNWIAEFTANRLIVVASNDTREYSFCRESLEVERYK